MLSIWEKRLRSCLVSMGLLWSGPSIAAGYVGSVEAVIEARPPYPLLAEMGCILPPTREDTARLSAPEFARQQTAIKQVLLYRQIRMLAERNRLSDITLRASARLAEELNAPAELAAYLRLLASDRLNSRQRYAVQSGLDAFLSAYLIDELPIRYFAELSRLSVADWADVVDWLPWEACFNMVPVEKDENIIASDYLLLRQVYSHLLCVYAGVQDKAGADAAADALLPSLILHESTAYTRLYAPQDLKNRLAPRLGLPLVAPAQALQKERMRLRAHSFYGSLRLRLLDLLLG